MIIISALYFVSIIVIPIIISFIQELIYILFSKYCLKNLQNVQTQYNLNYFEFNNEL